MLVLGIESSCDETAAAVVENGHKILSNVISSQDEIHAPYGGVVPELASRTHLESITRVVRKALDDAVLSMNDIDAVAVTAGPGLVVCLLVGISLAKALAFSRGLPIIGVNHLEGHLMAGFVEDRPVAFPFVGLLVSGGHTSLYLVQERSKVRTLGQTLDDAAGEAFDKVARVLGLPYPGGREIQELAGKGNSEAIAFPRSFLKEDHFNFSFSGLKTSVLKYTENSTDLDRERADIAASFQEAVVEVLVTKSIRACKDRSVKDIVVCGGVAANARLRQAMTGEAGKQGIRAHFPSPLMCTDNAAMIAGTGYYHLSRGDRSDNGLNARGSWPL